MALNPQQQLFKEAYLNPQSDTFGNAYRSALSAGFSDEYSKNITSHDQEWLSEILRDFASMQKAEQVLNEMLNMDEYDEARSAKLTSIKKDVAQFIVSRLKKEKWSERKELTAAGGKDLMTGLTEEQKAKLDNMLF